MGVAGSLHCIGMCGPLSMALPGKTREGRVAFGNLLLYQAGRILVYALLGLLLAAFGRGLLLAGLQQWISLAAGLAVLVAGILGWIGYRRGRFANSNPLQPWVFKQIGRRLGQEPRPRLYFSLGMLNGLLPCGMVYLALVSTLAFSHWAHTVLFMAGFGGGTLPAMLAFGLGMGRLSAGFRQRLPRLFPMGLVLVGCLLILRGANLGIPYISPAAPVQNSSPAIHCAQPPVTQVP